MSDIEIDSDPEGGEIRSEDETDLQVVQEQDNIQETEEQNTEDNAPQRQEPTIKRVRNPQPKLNADRLKGPRGIQTLEDLFKKIKFQGRGHEETDLNNLMRGYEYWCHRLFPKFTFDDCLEKIERLGTKKEMLTHIKKIRMNLLFLDDINGTVSNEVEDETQPPPTAEDPFDALLPTRNEELNEPNERVTQSNELSEEQLERMRINRERAKRIRLQKMISRQSVQNDSILSLHDVHVDPQPSSSQLMSNADSSVQNAVGNGKDFDKLPDLDFEQVMGQDMDVDVISKETSLPLSDHNQL